MIPKIPATTRRSTGKELQSSKQAGKYSLAIAPPLSIPPIYIIDLYRSYPFTSLNVIVSLKIPLIPVTLPNNIVLDDTSTARHIPDIKHNIVLLSCQYTL